MPRWQLDFRSQGVTRRRWLEMATQRLLATGLAASGLPSRPMLGSRLLGGRLLGGRVLGSRVLGGGLLGGAALGGGCWRAAANELVVYASLDREFSASHLERFERETGISVAPKYDVESTKTVGLANAILMERARPVCDLFWNNEILHTLRLARAGVLQPYQPPHARDFPPMFRDPNGLWHGFAARARILIVNQRRLSEHEWPRSVTELADARWKGQAGLAKPLFGTTATHAAVLFATWGAPRATAFFRQVLANAETLSGNKQVATAVGRGQLAWGLTDTDDAITEVENGSPVAIVFPDQPPGQPPGQPPDHSATSASDDARDEAQPTDPGSLVGSLLIPNTLAIVRDCRHPDRARQLVDFLLRPEVERELAAGPSAQFPLSSAVSERPRVEPAPTPKWMQVDFAAAAAAWDTAARVLRELYER